MNKKQKEQPPMPQVTDLLLELGNTYLEHGEYDKAINKLTQLIQLDQNNCDAFVNLSKAYILKKQFDTETQSILEQTLEYTPDDLLIYKVLSQMYLQEERLDERALKIYFKVFQQDKQNSENLFQKLLSLSLSKDKFETTQKLMQQLETGSFRFQQALQLYLNELWKKNKFEDASSYLKGILKSEQDNYFLRLFILNQLKANKIADSNFKIAEKNLDILINFVKSENSIDCLFDIYLFLAANRLLKKFPAKTNPKTAKQIEEFELFLSGNSFSNIWDRGLDKNISPVSDAGVDFNDLWEKLAIYLPDQNNFAQSEAEIAQQENFRTVLDNANCMMLIKTKQENIQDVGKFLSESIQSKTNKTKNFIQGFSIKDGLLIFWENVETLIKVAFDLVNKQSPQNNGDIINSYQTEIVLHTISLTNNRDYTYLFDDLEMALTILQPEKQLISKKTKDDVPIDQSQIYITSAVHNLVENESTILFTPYDIIAEHPVSHAKFLVYHLCP